MRKGKVYGDVFEVNYRCLLYTSFLCLWKTQLLNERRFFYESQVSEGLCDIAKTEKKVEDLQEQLKELYDKKTELENLEICLLYTSKENSQVRTADDPLGGDVQRRHLQGQQPSLYQNYPV